MGSEVSNVPQSRKEVRYGTGREVRSGVVRQNLQRGVYPMCFEL